MKNGRVLAEFVLALPVKYETASRAGMAVGRVEELLVGFVPDLVVGFFVLVHATEVEPPPETLLDGRVAHFLPKNPLLLVDGFLLCNLQNSDKEAET